MLIFIRKIIAVMLIIFGLTFLIFAQDLEFGSFVAPRPGFMPKVFSSIMILLSIFNLVNEWRINNSVPEDLRNVIWLRAGLFIISCVLYVVLLKVIGYLPATLIALFIMIKFTGIKGWLGPILATLGVSFGFWIIFTKILSVPLPKGILFN